MEKDLQGVLAFHCAPALAGIKPANLVACTLVSFPSLEREVCHLNQALNAQGICFRPVHCSGERILLLVYRKRVLENHLSQLHVRAYLRRAGYPEGGMESLLLHLQERLAEGKAFPHEMGIFLGYPPEDVEGFRRDGGRNCKLSGYWKVYGDVAGAKRMFERYTRCRNALFTRIANGKTIEELFGAA